MKFVDFVLLILLIAGVAIGIIWLAIKAFRPSNGKEVKETRQNLYHAESALWEIAAFTDKWSDVDSVLAGEIRKTLRAYRDKTRTPIS